MVWTLVKYYLLETVVTAFVPQDQFLFVLLRGHDWLHRTNIPLMGQTGTTHCFALLNKRAIFLH